MWYLGLSPDSLQKLSIKWLICSWIVFQTVHSCVSSSATYIYKLQKQHICVISTESTYLNICNMYLYLCILPVFSLQWKPIKPYLSFIPMNKCIVSLFRCFMFIFPKSSRDKHANIRGALGVKMSGRWRGGVTLWPDSPNIVRTADGKNLVYCSPLLSSTEPWLLTIAKIILPKPQKHLFNDFIASSFRLTPCVCTLNGSI